jgi:hypothetical protein
MVLLLPVQHRGRRQLGAPAVICLFLVLSADAGVDALRQQVLSADSQYLRRTLSVGKRTEVDTGSDDGQDSDAAAAEEMLQHAEQLMQSNRNTVEDTAAPIDVTTTTQHSEFMAPLKQHRMASVQIEPFTMSTYQRISHSTQRYHVMSHDTGTGIRFVCRSNNHTLSYILPIIVLNTPSDVQC